MMFDSATPLSSSKDIAFTAEFPDIVQLSEINHYYYKRWKLMFSNLKQELDQAIVHGGLKCHSAASHKLAETASHLLSSLEMP